MIEPGVDVREQLIAAIDRRDAPQMLEQVYLSASVWHLFIGAQLVGGALGLVIIRALFRDAAASAAGCMCAIRGYRIAAHARRDSKSVMSNNRKSG